MAERSVHHAHQVKVTLVGRHPEQALGRPETVAEPRAGAERRGDAVTETGRRAEDRARNDVERADHRVGPVAQVATERFVAAVAGQDDLQVLGRHLGDAEGRDHRRIAERLVIGVGQGR